MPADPIAVDFPLLGPGGKYYPGRRPARRQPSYVSRPGLCRPPSRNGEPASADWEAHLDALSRQVAAGEPVASGDRGWDGS